MVNKEGEYLGSVSTNTQIQLMWAAILVICNCHLFLQQIKINYYYSSFNPPMQINLHTRNRLLV
jgi:hypothetical protein